MDLIISHQTFRSLKKAEEAAKQHKKGKVIKPGTEVHDINEDDVIYYDKRAGHSMLIDDKPVTIILERDVVVVLD